MSAFEQPLSHIDLLVSAALATTRTAGRYSFTWFDVPLSQASSDTYQEGAPWGSLDWYEEHRRELTLDTAGRVGAMLAAENRRSVNHRYAEDDIEQPYEFHEVQGALSLGIGAILKAIDGYEYQSCEHPEWHTSEALQFCNALRRRLCSMVEGYDEADTWSYHRDRTDPTPISLMDFLRKKGE